MTDLSEFEVKILKEIAEPGSQEDLQWGAAMSVALEYLQGVELVTRSPYVDLTEKGKEYLTKDD